MPPSTSLPPPPSIPHHTYWNERALPKLAPAAALRTLVAAKRFVVQASMMMECVSV